ncbi:MAG: primosomal protein N' [Timaviella obliquedivisa GSE-PSE-MK23-08B]|jgi:primosomal protein N' (replication factor Y)|nr:primosomal protein N' [Timaviella obliquedivisa GSE-PSE-MK23-08B]
MSAPASLSNPKAAEPRTEYSMPARQWVEVLVDCPSAQGLFTYGLPADLSVQPGDVLSVPFGAQQVGAIAIALIDQLPPELDSAAVRPVEDIISQGFFPPTYWTLLQRVGQYYCTPLMQVVKVALPPGLLGRSQRRICLQPDLIPPSATVFLHSTAQQILTLLQSQKNGDYSWQYIQRQIRGANRGLKDLIQRGWVKSYLEAPTPVRPKQKQAVTRVANLPLLDLTSRQQEILSVLKRQGGEMWLQELLQTCQTSSSVLKTLELKGCVVIHTKEVLRLESSAHPITDHNKVLTPEQTVAVGAISNLTGYTPTLLHGVTGSGKTEVYLQAIAPLLNQGKSALVLVPEIGLTPQLTDRFRARFGDRVRVYHSALSNGERYDTWRQMLSGTPQVVIGTRSAIFAPLPNLGIIILDEEHDSSFKQDQPAPCYHARTVAQWRAELADCPLILGSATPSLESWLTTTQPSLIPSEVQNLRVKVPTPLYLSLPHRVQSRPMPPIQVVDMRQEFRHGNRSIFSRSLQLAIEQMVAAKQQGILFIHRRGHSTFVSCRDCGHVMECPHCDVSLSYHQAQEGGYQSLRCHYCGYGQTHPPQCPACASPYLKNFGSGTQRIMQELSRQFPNLRCLRFDSDTTRAKGSHRALLTRFAMGDADLLVGTQMLTKGIDLPQVTLVGIVAADGLLHLSDYRASERAFQTLTQVAGRAGRGEDPGQVILQTYSPEHTVVEAVKGQNYRSFVEAELRYRQTLNYPPYGRLVLLRLSGLNAIAVCQTAQDLATQIQGNHSSYELLGPAPAAIERLAGRYRWQILLKGGLDESLNLMELGEMRSHCPPGVSLAIDVDPLHLL